jgi:5'-3' exonuclease
MEAEDIVEHNQMFQQIVELSKVILPDMGFNNNFVFHGFEADDIIAHLLMEKEQEGRKIIISNDGDLYQLLDMADMYLFMMEKIFTKRLFVKKYGIKVSQWARAKAIGGCESDDVPGIEGVSDPKHVSSKALKFINKQLTKTGKIYARIVSKEGKKIIRRNKILVKLPYRPERIPPYEVAKDKVTLKKIIKVFTKYGFVSLCEREYFEKIEANFKG